MCVYYKLFLRIILYPTRSSTTEVALFMRACCFIPFTALRAAPVSRPNSSQWPMLSSYLIKKSNHTHLEDRRRRRHAELFIFITRSYISHLSPQTPERSWSTSAGCDLCRSHSMSRPSQHNKPHWAWADYTLNDKENILHGQNHSSTNANEISQANGSLISDWLSN